MSVGAGQREVLGRDIFEPHSWRDDGGKRVEAIVDPNWLIDGKPRVIRRIGWRNCMCCKGRMFSRDLHKVRMCDACKSAVTDMSERQTIPRGDRHWRKRGPIQLGKDPSVVKGTLCHDLEKQAQSQSRS